MENEGPKLAEAALAHKPEPKEEHPSEHRDDVSRDVLSRELKHGSQARSATVTSGLALACIQAWLFAAQFLSERVLFGSNPLGVDIFQDLATAAFLAVVAASMAFKKHPLRRWLNVGTVLLVVVPIFVGGYLLAARQGLSQRWLIVIAVVLFVVYGAALGNAFCGWVRLYVHFNTKMPLQIGLGFATSGIMSLALYSLPANAASVILMVLPVAIAAMLRFMSRAARNAKKISLGETEGEGTYIKAPRKLWASLATVGFVCGMSFGYVVADIGRALDTVPWLNVTVVILGVGIVVFYLATGKNPGFTIPSSALLAVTCVGQALMSSFGDHYFPAAFAVEFAGLLLFQMVLLLQLPSIFVRIKTLRTFFALWLTLKGFQFAAMLLRYFLVSGAVGLQQRWVAAATLCLAICVMAYAVRDSSVTTAWEYFPLHHAPKQRYVNACDDVEEAYGLTPREREILALVGRGRNGTYIQERLVISKSTYQTHMRNIYKKMDIHTDQELIDIIEEALDRRKVEDEKKNR